MMMKNNVVIGVDGGGTKTVSVCMNLVEQEITGRFKTGASNFNSVGKTIARKNLEDSIVGAIKEGNHEIEHVCGICLCMSGVDRPENKVLVGGWITEFLPHLDGCKILIYNDALGALSSGTDGVLHGICVVSGTGTIAFGSRLFDVDGKVIPPVFKRASGWGPCFGDVGGGVYIGYSALELCALIDDGRLSKKSLIVEKILSKCNLNKAEDLIGWVYEDGNSSWDKIASLSTVVFDCYKFGDYFAQKIIHDCAQGLADSIFAVHHELFEKAGFVEEKIPIIFCGGNLCHDQSPLAKILEQKLLEKKSNFLISFSKDSAIGAAKLISRSVSLK